MIMNCLRLQQLAVRVITTLVILAALQVQARQNRCPHWKIQCQHYEHKCGHGQKWTSCCVPSPGENIGSGFGSEMSPYPSEIYTIETGKFSKSEVWCDMDTAHAGGGWLTILRRTKDSVENFRRYAEDYMSGFGDLRGDFWLGLRTMQLLTRIGDWEMRVDLYSDSDNKSSEYVQYSSFKVHNFPSCKLQLGNFSRSDDYLYDSLREFNDEAFIVKQNQSDDDESRVCASGRGGWWYTKQYCFTRGSVLTKPVGNLVWRVLDSENTLKEKTYYRYEMKIRPKNCLAEEVGE